MNRKLWFAQIILALLFLFAGVAKFAMPVDAIVKQVHLPGWFIHFIGVAEVLGAMGLILPRLLRIQPRLTPLAAAGLLVIMIGAVVVTASNGPIVQSLFPLVTGILCAGVAWGRWKVAP